MISQHIEKWVAEVSEDIQTFAQRLIQTPSLSGQEENIAKLIESRLQNLGYDEVQIDPAGNVLGRIKGTKPGAVLFLSHMDHHSPGETSDWEISPYEGRIQDDYILGCGASDSKGAIVAQIYAGYLLKKLGVALPIDYIFAATVQEITGTCLGTACLFEGALKNDQPSIELVVLGNATSLDVYLGHRGRVEIQLETFGRTCHSSAPWLGINAIYQIAPVLEEVQLLSENLPSHHLIERATLTAINIAAQPGHSGAVPDRCILSLDRRFLPTESLDEVMGQIESIAHRISMKESNFKARVSIKELTTHTYTGYTDTRSCLMQPFLTDENHPHLARVLDALTEIQPDINTSAWHFHTDGSYTSGVLGILTLGYSPGEEKYSNTPFERIAIDKLIQSVSGYAMIYAAISGLNQQESV